MSERCPRCGGEANLTIVGIWCNICGLQLPKQPHSQAASDTVPHNAERLRVAEWLEAHANYDPHYHAWIVEELRSRQ